MTERVKEPSTTLCVSLPQDLALWVRGQAAVEDKQVSRIVRRALERERDRQAKKYKA